jgi:methylthioribose-1-phosphate isomerase
MLADFFTLRTITWVDDTVKMIDQTALPSRLRYLRYSDPAGMAQAIRSMVVRGAPAIGVAAAMGVALAAVGSQARTMEEFMRNLNGAATLMRSTRPTAVNLFWGIDRVLSKAAKARSVEEARESVVSEVKAMEDGDVETNRRLGKVGADLLEDGDTVLTQCNAGALATVGYGTALGAIRAAKEQGKFIKVVVPETRPALQGSRLTAFELSTDHIDCRVIPDTAVGYVMSQGRVDKVIVGADRITRDGYVFNKIGTYQEAVLAKRHRLPFYSAAPHSTFDLAHTHEDITIEERSFDEVVKIRGRRIAPKGVPVFNPAFDATPPELLTAIISDVGLVSRPIAKNLVRVIS